MPTNFNQYQIPQTITMFTVHGEEGANAFPVAPGQKVTLIDEQFNQLSGMAQSILPFMRR